MAVRLIDGFDTYRKKSPQYNRYFVPATSLVDKPTGRQTRACLACGHKFVARTKFLYRCDFCLRAEGWDVEEFGKRESRGNKKESV
jgi:hypothetical protein